VTPTLAECAALGRVWIADPIRFVRDQFHAEPDLWQAEALRQVAQGATPRTALKACKGPGKSCCMAWIIWWFLCCYPHSKVVATSVNGDNLRDNLWTELAKWQKVSPLLSQAFTWSVERIVSNEHPETWWASARTWSRSADPEQQGQTLAGLHADYILFVLDEAGSIPDSVAKTAEAALANAEPGTGRVAKLLIGGNPDMQEGPLWRACTSERASWNIVEVTGDPDDPKRAPRVSATWAREMIEKSTLGREDPWVMVNILGMFPDRQANKLLGPDVVAAAQARGQLRAAYEWCPKIMGVDCARYGNDRAGLIVRQGPVAYTPKVFRGLDLMTFAGIVANEIKTEKPAATFVDVGGLGAGVVDRLLQLGFQVTGADFGGRPIDPRFMNKKAEMWWAMAEWVRAGSSLPPSPELLADLVAPTYTYANAKGKFAIESKDDLIKRGIPSPDVADMLALTFYSPVAAVTHEQSVNAGKIAWDYDPMEA
jgi:phage terminase large subunit